MTAYVEWVLGVSRPAAAPFVVTEIDGKTGAMFARNAWRREFGARVAFADLGGTQTAWTADRTEFLGRNGSPDQPAALAPRQRLSGRVGAGLDPCGALQAPIELPAGGRAEVVFLLGEAASPEEARELIVRYRTRDVAAVLQAVGERWDELLGTVQVKTPDRSMDILLNRWLLYQTLACRVWARSAFYQAGGAYGFRDQLQDVMALAVAEPELARQHVLRAAARQFGEGDVQHWWHPPSGRGVRTRISDDLLWLPYVVAQYVEVAGDGAVLDEVVPFLEGPKLAVGQLESYFEPRASDEQGTLFEHCARALDHSLTAGTHGLPLMGTGDWNDGMNEVGAEGKGESVWLGWFLHAVLSEWAGLADARGEGKRAERWRGYVGALKESLEREAWDGGWYRRAYFDDGTPLGAAVNDACRIDSIAQSWSVISAAGDPARRERAMAAVDEHLVRRADGVVLLLTPPFDEHVPGARLHQGVCAGRPRERRAVHACGHLVGDRLRGARRRGQGRRALRDVESDQPRQHRSGRPALQGRAVRRRGGRLRRAAARRPRGLDVVHGIGGVDVSGRPRVDSRVPATRRAARDRPVYPARVARLRDGVPLSLRALRPRRREPPGGVAGRVVSGSRRRSSRRRSRASMLVDDRKIHRVRIVLG